MTDGNSRPDKDIWADDQIGRKGEAEMLLRFILAQLEFRRRQGLEQTYVLNLDAPWGGGKSFFLERFGQDLEKKGYIAARVNAWSSDHTDDPLLAVFSEVKSSLAEAARAKGLMAVYVKGIEPIKKGAGAIAVTAATGAFKQALRRYIGEGEGEEILEALGMDAADALSVRVVDAFENKKTTIVDFRHQLEELISLLSAEKGEARPVFVLVDELDRCRPDYAITLLERIKHLFSIDGLVFILATDTEQLMHTITGAYGPGFDSFRYLRRFFGASYRFREAPLESFVADRFVWLGLDEADFDSAPNTTAVQFLSDSFGYAKLQLRDIEQLMERLKTFVAIWPYAKIKVQLPYLVPLLHESIMSKQEVQAGGSSIRSMPIKLRETQDYGRSYREVTPQLERFIDSINRRGQNLFGTNNWDDTAIDNWVQRVLFEERTKIHNDSYVRGMPPSSVLLRYKDMLQIIARFDEEPVVA